MLAPPVNPTMNVREEFGEEIKALMSHDRPSD